MSRQSAPNDSELGTAKQITRAEQLAVAKEIALRQLSARARSTAELRAALSRRNVPDDIAAEVLERFREVELVDDVAFAEMWVTSRRRGKRSKLQISRELREKGISTADAAAALDQISVADDYESALELAQKKWRTVSGLPREVSYRRTAGMLTRRGFSSSVIAQVLHEVIGKDTASEF